MISSAHAADAVTKKFLGWLAGFFAKENALKNQRRIAGKRERYAIDLWHAIWCDCHVFLATEESIISKIVPDFIQITPGGNYHITREAIEKLEGALEKRYEFSGDNRGGFIVYLSQLRKEREERLASEIESQVALFG